MQYSVVALVALAASAAAQYSNGTVAYITEVHTAYTTVCPAATQLTFNGVTYSVTASTTLTITNCPCTVIKPITSTSVVASTPVYPNGTSSAQTTAPAPPVGTGTPSTGKPSPTPSTITANGGSKAIAFSGASLAGLVGLAAYIL